MTFLRGYGGVRQHISGTERVKQHTRDVRERRSKPATSARSKIFFVVESSGEVKCWPYGDFYKLWKKMHFNGLHLARDSEMAHVDDMHAVAGNEVSVPMSRADVLIHGITSGIVRSAKKFAKVAKENNRQRARVAVKRRAVKPKKTAKKIDGGKNKKK